MNNKKIEYIIIYKYINIRYQLLNKYHQQSVWTTISTSRMTNRKKKENNNAKKEESYKTASKQTHANSRKKISTNEKKGGWIQSHEKKYKCI